MNADSNKELVDILLVDRSQTDAKIIRQAFKTENFPCTVHHVQSGTDALDYLQHKGKYTEQGKFPLPQIIMSEINLPQMDGHTFVRELRNIPEASTIPVIIFTNKPGLKNVFKSEGVDDYVLKTLDAQMVVRKIKEILKFKDEFFGID